MKKKIIYFISFILIGITVFSGCITREINLSLNLKKGDTYKINMIVEQKINQDINDKKVQVEYKHNFAYSCFVTEVNENKDATVKVTFDSLNTKLMSNKGQTLEYTSGDKTEDVDKIDKVYSVMAGKSFDIKISSDGKVKEVLGIDEVIKKVIKELKLTDEKEVQEAEKIITDQFGYDFLKKQIESITEVYSDEAVKVGDTWKGEGEIPGEYPLESENKYTLKESKDEISEVEFSSNIKTKEGMEPVILGDTKINYELKGTQKGILNISEKTGVIKQFEMDYKYTGDMIFSSQDPNVGFKKFPITLEGKTTINITG